MELSNNGHAGEVVHRLRKRGERERGEVERREGGMYVGVPT